MIKNTQLITTRGKLPQQNKGHIERSWLISYSMEKLKASPYRSETRQR